MVARKEQVVGSLVIVALGLKNQKSQLDNVKGFGALLQDATYCPIKASVKSLKCH